jgi:hypothetical protein
VWAALARVSTEELQQRQFVALSDREAQTLLQGRRLGVARLRLLPKRSGMRFLVNLGKASVVRFPGARLRGAAAGAAGAAGDGVGGKRGRRAPAVKLTFRPVNSLLQNVYQVGGVGQQAGAVSWWAGGRVSLAMLFGHTSIMRRLLCSMVCLLVWPACRCCASRHPASPTCWAPRVGPPAVCLLHCHASTVAAALAPQAILLCCCSPPSLQTNLMTSLPTIFVAILFHVQCLDTTMPSASCSPSCASGAQPPR